MIGRFLDWVLDWSVEVGLYAVVGAAIVLSVVVAAVQITQAVAR